jgi:aminoglycoside N3'-acetyltransferase
VSRTISQDEVTQQLTALGVERGGVLVVHTAFSKVGPVEGGPHGLIAALLAALGPGGTLVMPSMSEDDDHPFAVASTSCAGLGVTADLFWRMPGVLRSDNPHAFAAIGPRAAEITRAHPLDVPHGLDSPIGRVFQLDGQVLLLGVGHDANTTVHLAENLAGVRYRRPKSVTVEAPGGPRRFEYEEIDHCCERFNRLDAWLDAEERQRRGTVGHASARLMASRDVVDVVVPRLQREETLFLHPPGECDECDDARASLGDNASSNAEESPPDGE